MKTFSILFVVMLAIAGSAYAQSDTSTTTAAQGTYPAGVSFSGIPISGLQIGTATLIAADGSAAEGHITVALLGTTPLGVEQDIIVEAEISGGSRVAPNVVNLSGTCSIDLGNGTPATTGVPFVATITTNDLHQGTVALVLGATTLPAATIGDGSMTIDDLPE